MFARGTCFGRRRRCRSDSRSSRALKAFILIRSVNVNDPVNPSNYTYHLEAFAGRVSRQVVTDAATAQHDAASDAHLWLSRPPAHASGRLASLSASMGPQYQYLGCSAPHYVRPSQVKAATAEMSSVIKAARACLPLPYLDELVIGTLGTTCRQVVTTCHPVGPLKNCSLAD